MMGSANAKRFASKMDAVMSKIEYDTNGGCWLWSGAPNTYGYGQISWDDELYLAHRVAYESRHGDVPEGLSVLHRCDTPACCNPAHLFAGTPRENTHDMLAKGRHWVPVGEQHPNAKLTDAQVVEIRARYAAGHVTEPALAREFGVSRGSINAILRRRTYRHLGDIQCQ